MSTPHPATTTELVAVCLQSGEDLVRRIFEAWEAGLAVLPLDPLLPGPMLAKILDAARPSRLVTEAEETILKGVPISSRTAAVVLTSGTSGETKGVELSHSALGWSARASAGALGEAGDGRWLCCLPLHHIAGLMVVLRAKLAGGLPIVHDRFDPEAVADEKDAVFVSLVPSALTRLLDAKADLSRFSAILLGGGPVSGPLLERAAEQGARVVTTYGMTETCGGCVFDGFPLEGARVRLAEEQVQIQGPMLFSGYRLRPELTGAVFVDGWFHTADRGRFLPDGRLEILGRLDDIIVTGGKKVSAGEVERNLVLHPSIMEAAVVGLHSEQWGQEIAAALVLHPGKSVELKELRDYIAQSVPRWTGPRRIIEVSSLPKSSTGKVLRRQVAQMFE